MLNPPMALLASCPLLQWRKASPPKHTINFLKDNEKRSFKYKNKATTEETTVKEVTKEITLSDVILLDT